MGEDEAAPQGQVLAVGPGGITSTGGVAPMQIAKGDFVMFTQFSGADVVLEGGKFKVVRAANCMAKW